MRIWSLHPKYLDSKGLIALWREALLAKNVLAGKTQGYRNHPQLARFKKANSPLDSINQYLAEVYKEANERGYNFNREKINWNFTSTALKVTAKQIEYETKHLMKKLEVRDVNKFHELQEVESPDPHPLFHIIRGEIEEWEIV